MMRIDAFIIWGHGLPKIKDILEEIEGNENFRILRIERYKPKNMRSFVYFTFNYAYRHHVQVVHVQLGSHQ